MSPIVSLPTRAKIIAAVSLILALFTVQAHATVVGSSSVKVQIISITTFPQYGAGDVVVKTDTAITGCEAGYWLKPSDPGFDQGLAVMMSAYLADKKVILMGEDGQIWPGSTGKYCRIYVVTM